MLSMGLMKTKSSAVLSGLVLAALTSSPAFAVSLNGAAKVPDSSSALFLVGAAVSGLLLVRHWTNRK